MKKKSTLLNKIELRQEFFIESARFLKQLPKSHPCSQTHGHSFKTTFVFRGDLNPHLGWLEDYKVLETQIKPVLQQIDHKLLNSVKGLENPTTENLCIWLYKKVKRKIPSLHQVIIKETHNTECTYPIE